MMQNLKTKELDYYLSLRYRIVLTPEEDGWSAVIPDLPGCIGAGDTREEALMMMQDAQRSWVEASLQHNLPIPEPSDYVPSPD